MTPQRALVVTGKRSILVLHLDDVIWYLFYSAKCRATGNEDDKTADHPSAKKRSRQVNDMPDDLYGFWQLQFGCSWYVLSTSIETSCVGTGSQTADSLIKYVFMPAYNTYVTHSN